MLTTSPSPTVERSPGNPGTPGTTTVSPASRHTTEGSQALGCRPSCDMKLIALLIQTGLDRPSHPSRNGTPPTHLSFSQGGVSTRLRKKKKRRTRNERPVTLLPWNPAHGNKGHTVFINPGAEVQRGNGSLFSHPLLVSGQTNL